MPAGSDGEFVTTMTYVKGAGEVTKSQTLEKKGAAPQLTGEAKQVSE